MTVSEAVFVTTPIAVTFEIEKDATGVYVGLIKEYPGIISQGRTRGSTKRKLIQLLREISRTSPQDLKLFR